MGKTEKLIQDIIETIDYYEVDLHYQSLWNKDKLLFIEKAKKIDKEEDCNE